MIYRGYIKDGMVILDDPVRLPEGARVQIDVISTVDHSAENAEIPRLYERLKPFIGCIKDLPPDASTNLDHYLYGMPKRS